MRRALLEGGARGGVELLAADPIANGRVCWDFRALPFVDCFL